MSSTSRCDAISNPEERVGGHTRAWGVLIGGVLVIVAGLALAVIGGDRDRRFETDGERIYFTGRNKDGQRIAYRGGSASGMMMAGGLTCASCHGGEAQGGRHRMYMVVMDAPDIRWSTLLAEAEGEHAGDAVYGLAVFRQAVVEGWHPDGTPLSDLMPRWQLSDRDISALAAFLQSLRE